jgi:hypothetical protein
VPSKVAKMSASFCPAIAEQDLNPVLSIPLGNSADMETGGALLQEWGSSVQTSVGGEGGGGMQITKAQPKHLCI